MAKIPYILLSKGNIREILRCLCEITVFFNDDFLPVTFLIPNGSKEKTISYRN